MQEYTGEVVPLATSLKPFEGDFTPIVSTGRTGDDPRRLDRPSGIILANQSMAQSRVGKPAQVDDSLVDPTGMIPQEVVNQPAKRESVLEGMQMPAPQFDSDEAERLSNRRYAEATAPSSAPSLKQWDGKTGIINTGVSSGNKLQDFAANAVGGATDSELGLAKLYADALGLDDQSYALKQARQALSNWQATQGSETLAGKVGHMAGAVAPALLTGGGLATDALLFASPMANDAYQNALEAGKSQEEARADAGVAFAFGIGMPFAAGRAGKATSALMDKSGYAAKTAAEAATGGAAFAGLGGAQRLTQASVDNSFGRLPQAEDPDQTTAEFITGAALHLAPHAVAAARPAADGIIGAVNPRLQAARELSRAMDSTDLAPADVPSTGIVQNQYNSDPSKLPSEIAYGPGYKPQMREQGLALNPNLAESEPLLKPNPVTGVADINIKAITDQADANLTESTATKTALDSIRAVDTKAAEARERDEFDGLQKKANGYTDEDGKQVQPEYLDSNEQARYQELKGKYGAPEEGRYKSEAEALEDAKARGIDKTTVPIQTGEGDFVLAPVAKGETVGELKQKSLAVSDLANASPEGGKPELVTGTNLHDGEADPARRANLDRASSAIRLIASATRTAFGWTPIVIRGIGDSFGVQYKGHAFLNIDAIAQSKKHDAATLAVYATGHEVTHILENSKDAQDQADYAAFKKVVMDYVKPESLNARVAEESAYPNAQQRGEGEVVADASGAMWQDPKFWGRLYELDNGSTMRRIAYKFMEAATKFMKAFKGSRQDVATLLKGESPEELQKSIEAVREAAAQVWARQAMKRGEAVSRTKAKEELFDKPQFARDDTDRVRSSLGGRRRVSVDEVGEPHDFDTTGELGNFNLDDAYDEYMASKGGSTNSEAPSVADTPADQLAAQADANQPVNSPNEVTVERMKLFGIFPEKAFPFPEVRKHANGIALAPHSSYGDITFRKQPGDLYTVSAGTRSDWFVNSKGFTEPVAVMLAKAHAARPFVTDSGYDINSAYRKSTINKIANMWLEVAKKPGAFKMPDRSNATDVLQIARDMKAFDGYEVRATANGNIKGTTFRFKDKSTGAEYEAHTHRSIEPDGFAVNTMNLKGSSVGTQLYAVLAEWAHNVKVPFDCDGFISDVNTFRRTEQAFSFAIKSGDSGVLLPGPQNRVYGYVYRPKTAEDHIQNIARLALANMRNVIEVLPDTTTTENGSHRVIFDPKTDTFKDEHGKPTMIGLTRMVYDPSTGKFFDQSGRDISGAVKKWLNDPQNRGPGIGASTLARAAMTNQMIMGKLDTSFEKFATPVAYARNDEGIADAEPAEGVAETNDPKEAGYDYNAALEKKWPRMRQFDKDRDSILERVHADAKNGKEEAAIIRLISRTGFRIGGEGTSKGEPTYGAASLRPEHVEIDGDNVTFNFRGKSGVQQVHTFTDPELARDLEARKASGNPTLFTKADRAVRRYHDSIIGDKDYKVHDYRTWVATNAAKRIVDGLGQPESPEELKEFINMAADEAARKIGDDRATALKSYIDPEVFAKWREGLEQGDARPDGASEAGVPQAGDSGAGKRQDERALPEQVAYARRDGPKELDYKDNYLVPELDEFKGANGVIAHIPALSFQKDGMHRQYPAMPVRIQVGNHVRPGEKIDDQYGLQHRIENQQKDPQYRGYITPKIGETSADQVERAARDVTRGVLEGNTAYIDGKADQIYLHAPDSNRETVLQVKRDANGEKYWSVKTSQPSTRERMMGKYKAPTSVGGITSNGERTQQAFDIKRGILDKLKEPGQSPVSTESYILDDDNRLVHQDVAPTQQVPVTRKPALARDENGKIILNKNKVQTEARDTGKEETKPADDTGLPLFLRKEAGEEEEKRIGVMDRIKQNLTEAQTRLSDLIDGALSPIYDKLAPMSNGSDKSRAIAQDWVNKQRVADWQWGKIDEYLTKNFTVEQRAKMWDAADEQNELLASGEPTKGKGLDRLNSEERAAVEQLHDYGEELLARAKAVGMFKGDGVPYWTPRMMAMIDEKGDYVRPKEDRAAASGGVGRNLTTSSSNLKQRKYLSSVDTEEAMMRLGGVMVHDIRTMPLALGKLEKAISGRELINQIKDLGRATGAELVSPTVKDGYFTIDHPAFTQFTPRLEQVDGKWETVKDADGNVIFDKQPLYIHNSFEGPLKAVLSEKSSALYSGYMLLKNKAMSAIMYSPLIHGQVILGRALAYGKLKTPILYFTGNAAKKDTEFMRKMIGAGMVPIGERSNMLDVGDLAHDQAGTLFQKSLRDKLLDPDESWLALGVQKVGNYLPGNLGDKAKAAMDVAGDFWHNTLLWRRIGDLQAGIAQDVYNKLLAKGATDADAASVAAHIANRYAGAIGRESMSQAMHKFANVMLFSKSFNAGNIGQVKDAFYGLPAGIRSQIFDRGDKESIEKVMSFAKSKARWGLVTDLAAAMLVTSLVQDLFREDKRGYMGRAEDMLEEIKKNPTSASSYNPYRLSSTWGNEPDKRDRVDMGAQPNSGRHEYMRLPTGKVVEDIIGWTMHPAETFKNKMSPLAQFASGIVQNAKDKYGTPVWNPDGKTLEKAYDAAKFFVGKNMPIDQMQAAIDVMNGVGTDLDKKKLQGNLTGLTVSQGHPLGPEGAVAQGVEDRISTSRKYIMERVKRDLKYGEEDKAYERLIGIGLTPKEASAQIRKIENPRSSMTAGQRKKFNQHANQDDRDTMDGLQ
jgi:hypothetical protein